MTWAGLLKGHPLDLVTRYSFLPLTKIITATRLAIEKMVKPHVQLKDSSTYTNTLWLATLATYMAKVYQQKNLPSSSTDAVIILATKGNRVMPPEAWLTILTALVS